MKSKLCFWGVVFATLLCSCSGDKYLDAVPGNSIALVAVDLNKVVQSQAQAPNSQVTDENHWTDALKSLLQVDDINNCGINLSSKLYIFETPDGSLGMAADVKDEDGVKAWLKHLAEKGTCQEPMKRRGGTFTVLKKTWVVGFNNHVLVMVGPTVASQQAETIRKIAKWLKQDNEDGIADTPIYNKVETMQSPVAMVAQADALPDRFIAPFILGMPENADLSQVMIQAEMYVNKEMLDIKGKIFSFDTKLDSQLQKTMTQFRPIKGKYNALLSGNALLTMVMNVNGKNFVPIMLHNKALQLLMAGVNTVIDMDNILKSVDGDMMVALQPLDEGSNLEMTMSAQLGNTAFWKDLDYWRKSCPVGGHIMEWNHAVGGKEAKGTSSAYYYKDGKTKFFFGSTSGVPPQFYCSTNEHNAKALASGSQVANMVSMPQDVIQKIDGERFCMVLNLNVLNDEKMRVAAHFLKPLFGKVNLVFYSIQ